jgi:hypothetical protein
MLCTRSLSHTSAPGSLHAIRSYGFVSALEAGGVTACGDRWVHLGLARNVPCLPSTPVCGVMGSPSSPPPPLPPRPPPSPLAPDSGRIRSGNDGQGSRARQQLAARAQSPSTLPHTCARALTDACRFGFGHWHSELANCTVHSFLDRAVSQRLGRGGNRIAAHVSRLVCMLCMHAQA